MTAPEIIRLGTQVGTVLSTGTPDHDVAVVDTLLPPGAGAPRHVHFDHDELFYVVAGEVEVHLDGHTQVATTGGFIFAGKGMVHAFKNKSAEDARLLAIYGPASTIAYLRELSKIIDDDGSVDAGEMSEFYVRFNSASGS
ncbi:MAG: cupin domain-containing protein [Acidimicrobiia bacterium]